MSLKQLNIFAFLGLFLIAGTLYLWGQPGPSLMAAIHSISRIGTR